MSRFVLIPTAFLAVLVFAACEDHTTAPAPATTTAPAATSIADEDLAVPADFEEDAEKTITVANYKTELDALESEVVN